MGILLEIVESLLKGEDLQSSLKEKVRKATKVYNNLFLEDGTISRVAKEIQREVMDRQLFGCQRGNVLRVLSIVLKENLREYREEISIPLLSLVKIKDEMGNHNYELGKPYLYLGRIPPRGHHVASGPAGGLGNNIPRRLSSLERVGEEELEGFFKSFQPTRFIKGVCNGFEGD
jgi:hypothetical protein